MRGLTSISLLPPPPPLSPPSSALLFLSWPFEAEGKEEEEKENGERSRWGNARGEIAGGTTWLSWRKEEREGDEGKRLKEKMEETED